jgi:cytochrome c oxidase assembly factor CtaG/polyferredoxin
MSPELGAFLRSWPFDPWLLLALGLTAAVYLRGWRALKRRDAERWHAGRPAAFLGGLFCLFIALASPVEPFAALLLQVHMLQHLLLMMAAPPLLWLGAPLLPLLRGLPRPLRTHWAAPLLRSPALRALFGWLTQPVPAWLLFAAATWLWHVPAFYEVALRSPGWHYLQHFCFLATGLLFWYVVVRPYPARPRWSPWLLLPYLLLADVQNTVLSAVLTFSDRVLYPYYAEAPRLGGLSPLEDQSAAGVLMWVPGSLAFLLPLFAIAVRLLYARDPAPAPPVVRGRIPLPLTTSPPHHRTTARFDLLRLPLLGRFLRWRHARLALQLPLAVLAALVVWDGLRGPEVGPMNLAGVLPWVHWRGFVVLGLLAAGNVACMTCPFTVPRRLARRWLPAGRSWPRALRSKWLALGLLVLFLWAYEALALWGSPWWTAWIVVGYFVAAFAVDGLFRGAAFCKYVCPIGQFNFVGALVSPLEVAVRDPAVCSSCRTRDCVRGRDGVPGCELHLHQPRKASNMDCTFCLDCVHACPHDNVGVTAVTPGRDLWTDSYRSGVGRFSRRPDLAALVLVLTFGAFANAAGMVAPVLEWRDRLRAPLLGESLFYVAVLVLLPALAAGVAAALGRRWGALKAGPVEVATRFAFALVPLGLGMWLAHYGFHLLTGYDAALPAAQRFAGDLGLMALGAPEWVCNCCRPVGDWALRLELLALGVGLLLSLYAGHRIARSLAPHPGRATGALAPWALLMLLLFAVGVWLVFQPMQMRGTMQGMG